MPGANLHGHAGDALQPYGQLFARRVSHYSNPEDIASPAVKPIAIQNAILNNQYDKQPFGVTLRVAKNGSTKPWKVNWPAAYC